MEVFSKYFRVNQTDNNLAKLPEEMSLKSAIMIPDMLSTGFKGAENQKMELVLQIALLGIGPVGLCKCSRSKIKRNGKNIFCRF